MNRLKHHIQSILIRTLFNAAIDNNPSGPQSTLDSGNIWTYTMIKYRFIYWELTQTKNTQFRGHNEYITVTVNRHQLQNKQKSIECSSVYRNKINKKELSKGYKRFSEYEIWYTSFFCIMFLSKIWLNLKKPRKNKTKNFFSEMIMRRRPRNLWI